MEVLTRVIAANRKKAWSIVFIPDERHIYIGRAIHGVIPDPLEGETVEEFLAWLPRNKLHRKAQANFIAMLKEFLQNDPRFSMPRCVVPHEQSGGLRGCDSRKLSV